MPPPPGGSGMTMQVLLVDPQAQLDWIRGLQDTLGSTADLKTVADFHAAHAMVRAAPPPDMLVTNVRLGAYNGIQLVMVAVTRGLRCVVYAEEHDVVLARQAQEAGAFYVRLKDLRESFDSLLRRPLPPRDRRNPEVDDRRRLRRGGRRSNDLPAGD